MKTLKSTEEQIAFTLKKADLGTPSKEVIRKTGITEQTYCRGGHYGGSLSLRGFAQLKDNLQ